MRAFGYDGPIMSFLAKVMDLFFLNILILVFSIPLITIGAVTTAAHFTSLKIRRDEGHVWSCFWRSFKQNFKQSTCIWLIFLVFSLISIVFYNIAIKMGGVLSPMISVTIMSVFLFVAILYVWIMPLQGRFINTIKGNFKNSFFMTFRYLFRTLLMVLVNFLPIGTFYLCVVITQMRGFWIWSMFGISVPIYLCVMIYDKIFEKLEEMVS